MPFFARSNRSNPDEICLAGPPPPYPPPVPPPSSTGIVDQSSQYATRQEEKEKESCRTESEVGDDDVSIMTQRAERRFLLKLDVLLLTWAWMAYLIKQIDTSNYKTSYASGMKEALGLYGNELNYLDTTFRVGYAIFLIPSQIILTKIRPSYWLPGLEIAWGICTGLMAVCSSVKGMYALRFLIGAMEASSYPGIICIICAWYTPSEIATRIVIFGTSYPAANIFVGFMQAALHKNMDGVGGLPGWKWLFVFNAIMTVIVAVTGFLFIPDDPADSHVSWLNDAEKKVARDRVLRVKKMPPTKLSISLIKKVFSSWVIYVFCLAYATWSWSQNANAGWIVLFLKSVKNVDGTKRFSIEQLNTIPIGGYILQIGVMLGFGWLSGRTGWRARLLVVQELTLLAGALILSAWPASFVVKMVGFFLLWLSNAAGPILISWMAELCPMPEERALIVGVAITLTFSIDAFANIFIYPAEQAPHYKIGYKAAAGFAIACIAFTGLFWRLDRRTKAEKRSLYRK